MKSPDCNFFAQHIREFDEKSANLSQAFSWTSGENAGPERKRTKPTFSTPSEPAYCLRS
jgi:hypothetical protein